MTAIPYIAAADVAGRLSWIELIDWMVAGHQQPQAQIGDVLLGVGDRRLLNRTAWIDGYGVGVKAATVFPANANANPPLPTAHSVVTLFDPNTGIPTALLEGSLVTRFKTAGDSVLGARFLARPSCQRLLVIGAGVVGDSVIEAYSAVFPTLNHISVWNRTPSRAAELARVRDRPELPVEAAGDLSAAVAQADIIVCATMTTSPLLKGEWVKPGTHIDLIGAYTPDMREADDTLIAKSRIFVDSRATAIHDIGELAIPLRDGVITEADVLGDLYDLCGGAPARTNDQQITLYKNGGGAHLDVMSAAYILTKTGSESSNCPASTSSC